LFTPHHLKMNKKVKTPRLSDGKRWDTGDTGKLSLTQSTPDEGMLDALDATLRAQVRRDGIDPQRDREVLRSLAQRVVGDHDRRSLTGAVLPLADADAVVETLVANLSGFGPLQPYLDDPEIEEIWVNDPSRVFVARAGRHELTPVILTKADVTELVERMLKSSGRGLDVSQSFVDALLAGGGSAPARLARRRAEHPGGRRNSGRQDHRLERARRGDPRGTACHHGGGRLRAMQPFLGDG
jgi:hypothetical protein